MLIHQIENKTYEKYLLGQTNFDRTLPESIKKQAILAVKDEYTFDFLDLADEHSERQLEAALVNNVRVFVDGNTVRYLAAAVFCPLPFARFCLLLTKMIFQRRVFRRFLVYRGVDGRCGSLLFRLPGV